MASAAHLKRGAPGMAYERKVSHTVRQMYDTNVGVMQFLAVLCLDSLCLCMLGSGESEIF